MDAKIETVFAKLSLLPLDTLRTLLEECAHFGTTHQRHRLEALVEYVWDMSLIEVATDVMMVPPDTKTIAKVLAISGYANLPVRRGDL